MTVFVRYGYRLTGMERVGQEAGVSRQAVYNHFETKEALFRAAVEQLSEGAHDAARQAGEAAEADGKRLSSVLSAQLVARWRYFTDRLDGSPHADELMSEHHRQTQDLKAAYDEGQQRMLEETITRHCECGTRLKDGMSAADLARLLVFAERGAKGDPRGAGGLGDLETIVELLVRGATEPPDSET